MSIPPRPGLSTEEAATRFESFMEEFNSRWPKPLSKETDMDTVSPPIRPIAETVREIQVRWADRLERIRLDETWFEQLCASVGGEGALPMELVRLKSLTPGQLESVLKHKDYTGLMRDPGKAEVVTETLSEGVVVSRIKSLRTVHFRTDDDVIRTINELEKVTWNEFKDWPKERKDDHFRRWFATEKYRNNTHAHRSSSETASRPERPLPKGSWITRLFR